MRRIIGPMLKVFAFFILILFVGAGVALEEVFRYLSIPSQLSSVHYVVLGMTGLLCFLLLYARGQNVQSLLRLTELEEASKETLQELVSLLRAQPVQNPFGPRFDIHGPGDEMPSSWRRRELSAPTSPPKMRAASSAGQIACSLCGTVQRAGQPACSHCGASFAGAAD